MTLAPPGNRLCLARALDFQGAWAVVLFMRAGIAEEANDVGQIERPCVRQVAGGSTPPPAPILPVPDAGRCRTHSPFG